MCSTHKIDSLRFWSGDSRRIDERKYDGSEEKARDNSATIASPTSLVAADVCDNPEFSTLSISKGFNNCTIAAQANEGACASGYTC